MQETEVKNQKNEKLKKENAITLIALIITIIVMLILVGVTVAVALNGGLFSTAKNAATRTQVEADRETLQSAVIGAIDTKKLEIPDANALLNNLPGGWEVTENGQFTCKSPKGNIFKVTKNGYEIELYEGGNTGSVEVTLADGSTVKLTKENFGEYLGKKVANYKTIGGTETVVVGSFGYQVSTTYRLYYIDFDNKYKEGAGTVYLKADQGPDDYIMRFDGNEATSKIKNLNPSLYAEGVIEPINTNKNMTAVTWLTDTAKWNGLMLSGANSEIGNKVNYVIGAPSLEMMMDSYNEHYKLTGDIPDYTDIPASPDTTRKKLFYKYTARNTAINAGYQVGPNADSDLEYSTYTSDNSVKTDSEIDSMYYPGTDKYYWLASPSDKDSKRVMCVRGDYGGYVSPYSILGDTAGFCPLVSLQSNINLKLVN